MIFLLSETNIALYKNATQLGTFWGPEKAVDGYPLPSNPDDPEQQHCSASEGGTPDGTDNFWQVDLQGLYSIGLIVVYGRTDGE